MVLNVADISGAIWRTRSFVRPPLKFSRFLFPSRRLLRRRIAQSASLIWSGSRWPPHMRPFVRAGRSGIRSCRCTSSGREAAKPHRQRVLGCRESARVLVGDFAVASQWASGQGREGHAACVRVEFRPDREGLIRRRTEGGVVRENQSSRSHVVRASGGACFSGLTAHMRTSVLRP